MNEAQARHALLVRAYETAPPGQSRPHWDDDDRDWATRAALEVEGESASVDAFLSRRAELASERVRSRDRGADRALHALRWRAWFGSTLILLAFAAGYAADAIGAQGRINLLSPPLLALVAWNLLAYAVLLARFAASVARGGTARPGPLARFVARASHAVASLERRAARSSVVSSFVAAWLAASASITAARVMCVIHLCAAAFAAGAIGGMYVRGLGLAYLAGWESTFLGPDTVHQILRTVLSPAVALTGIALPDAEHIASIRFGFSPGEGAARWIHLYAASIALLVVMPRAALAAANGWRARGLARRFELPLDDPYFVALIGAHSGLKVRVRIVPYSYRLGPQAALALEALVRSAFGANSLASIATAIEFGDEAALDASVLGEDTHEIVAALFAATATPEAETHGAFLAALAALVPAGAPMLVLVDESTFYERFGRDAQALARRDERRRAWARMLDSIDLQPVFVDLAAADSGPAAQPLKQALAAGPDFAAPASQRPQAGLAKR
ncbi:MAG: DUF2868 domain-containing protein [Burkholderiaceae bacterium]|nr:DUF2868 domain-containing protein [Burkholderiaceae bacterium]